MLRTKKDFQVELAKYLSEKDFVYGPEPELYSPIAGFYSYGLVGKALKNNLENVIRSTFIENNFFEVECPIILPEVVWEASGHLKGFNDPIIVCSKCKNSFRLDKLIEEVTSTSVDHLRDEELIKIIKEKEINCPNCKGRLILEVSRQSLMLKTIIGKDTIAYNRPETATATYLPFKHYTNFFRGKLPFTVFQIGKAFRNEISPRQHLLRQREFTQAEAQIFIDPKQKQVFEGFSTVSEKELPLWSEENQKSGNEVTLIKLSEALNKKVLKNQAYAWGIYLAFDIFTRMGIPKERIRLRQHHADEKAFYAEDAWDLEINLNSFGWTECCGIHDRNDYDLTQHQKHSKQDLSVLNEANEKIIPHVIEIAFGVDRPFFALLDLNFYERKESEKRTVLSLPPNMAPIQVGVLPLMKKDGLPQKAREIMQNLKGIKSYFDESGSIGKRYSRLDAIGVPYCVTIDHDSLKEETITIRDRDTQKQIKCKVSELRSELISLISGEKSF